MPSGSRRSLALAFAFCAAAACLIVGVWFARGPRQTAGPPTATESSGQEATLGEPGAGPSAAHGVSSETLAERGRAGSDSEDASLVRLGIGVPPREGWTMSANGSFVARPWTAGDAAWTNDAANDADTSPSEVLRVRVRWKNTREPIPRVPVALFQGERSWGVPRTGTTDEKGEVEIRYPASWDKGYAVVLEPRMKIKPRVITLPAGDLWSFDVERAFSAHGCVYARGENGAPKPVAGAMVMAIGKEKATTLSGEDGSWRLDQIPDDQVALVAMHGNLYSPATGENATRRHLLPERDNGPFDLYLEKPTLTLTGAVLRESDLAPIPSATVRVEELAIQDATDARGGFMIEPLPDGVFEISASAEGYADAFIQATMKEGEETTVMFHMKPGGNLRVRGLDRDGVPVERAILVADNMPDNKRTIVRTDPDGWVSWDRIPTDRPYSIKLWLYREYSNQETVRFPPGETDLSVTLKFGFSQAEDEQKGPQAVYAGTVADEGGHPIEGATVQFQKFWDSTAEGGSRVKTGPDGRYFFKMGFAYPSYTVSAYAEGYATQWKAGQPGGSLEKPAQVDFQLRSERTVRGTVVDPEERPIAGVQAWVSQPDNPGCPIPGQPVTLTRADGTFWIRGLDGDRVPVHLEKRGWQAIGQQAATDLENRFTMHPLSPGALRGRVVDAETQRPIPDFAVRIDYGEPRSFFSEDGRFRIDELTQGVAYNVRIESLQYNPLSSSAAAGASDGADETVFALSRPRPLEGVVVDAATGQPVAGATVLSRRREGGANWIDWSGSAHSEDSLAQTGADGRFSIAVSGADALVAARADGYAPIAIPPAIRAQYADPASGALRIPLGRGATLTCSYVLDGQPQANRTIHLHLQNEGGSTVVQMIGQKETDNAGTAVWEHVPPGLAIAVCYSMSPSPGPGAADSRTIRLNEGDSKRIDFGEFPGSATAHGSVLQDGTPQPNLTILFQPVSGEDPGARSAASDSQGQYRIVGLVPGSYQVSVLYVETSGGAQRTITCGAKNSPVNVAAGENQIDIQVSPPAIPTPGAP